MASSPPAGTSGKGIAPVAIPRRRPRPAPAPTPPEIVPAVPAWAALHDDELLAMRICDLDLRLAGSEVEPRVAQLHAELAARGLLLRPECYLGDEWFTPSGTTLIALPFYLAHPRLRLLERRMMREVEGGTDDECMRLLRHECGHALDHAYRFSRRPRWRELFGRSDENATPDVYRPRPYSRSYVQHLKNHYAQAHPDEDFAETFAVVLGTPEVQWRRRYRGWKALAKLEYVSALLDEAARRPPPRRPVKKLADARRVKKTLARYYAERRRAYAEDFPDFLDPDLLRIFGPSGPDGAPVSNESAARFLRRRRDAIVSAVVDWSGAHKYTVDELLRRLIARCEALALAVTRDEARAALDVGAYLAAMVTTHLHTGRYKRTV